MRSTPNGIVLPKPAPTSVKIWGRVTKKQLGEMIGEMIHANATFIVDASEVRAVSGRKADRPE